MVRIVPEREEKRVRGKRVQSAHHSCRAITPRRLVRRRAQARRGSLHPWSQALSHRRRLAVQVNQSHPPRRVSRVQRRWPRRDINAAGAATSRAGRSAPPQPPCRRRENCAARRTGGGHRASPGRALAGSPAAGGPGTHRGRSLAPPRRSGGPPTDGLGMLNRPGRSTGMRIC